MEELAFRKSRILPFYRLEQLLISSLVFEADEYARRTEKVVANTLHDEDEKAGHMVETKDRV